MIITFPTNTKEIIDAIREAIGRDVTFQTKVETECTYSGCNIDPITNTSINSFCPVCSGVGYTSTLDEDVMKAHIFWKPEGFLNWVTAGQYFTGDCAVQIEYTEDIYEMVSAADYVVVDGKRLRMKSRDPRGVPALNRILLDCELEEE